MHELSITQSVVDAVLEKLPDQPIAVVSLEIGTLSGIEPDALRFCFELVTAGTTLQGAELQISRPHMGFAVEQVDAARAEAAMAGLEMMGRPRDGSGSPGGP